MMQKNILVDGIPNVNNISYTLLEPGSATIQGNGNLTLTFDYAYLSGNVNSTYRRKRQDRIGYLV